ncbi:hypothetical protein [Streptomyces sp. ST2-7A]|uniref:hypothetical protein n=1 Tax=Streptomyces sp. ST2-7A TaxID=2907214 RepID=UPI001F2C6BDA|nr:hypothetical protein [Streptomyces sp. ST2-7A]MCE7081938.1 hypothetical protein [Streptomyces sp. ST2-7A]
MAPRLRPRAAGPSAAGGGVGDGPASPTSDEHDDAEQQQGAPRSGDRAQGEGTADLSHPSMSGAPAPARRGE